MLQIKKTGAIFTKMDFLKLDATYLLYIFFLLVKPVANAEFGKKDGGGGGGLVSPGNCNVLTTIVSVDCNCLITICLRMYTFLYFNKTLREVGCYPSCHSFRKYCTVTSFKHRNLYQISTSSITIVFVQETVGFCVNTERLYPLKVYINVLYYHEMKYFLIQLRYLHAKFGTI